MGDYIEQKKNLEEQGWNVSNSVGGKSYFGKPGISGLVVEVDQVTGDAEIHKGCPGSFAEKHKPVLHGGARPGAGRPPAEDKRIARSIKFSDAEWAEVKEKAEAAATTISDYIRGRVLD